MVVEKGQYRETKINFKKLKFCLDFRNVLKRFLFSFNEQILQKSPCKMTPKTPPNKIENLK